MACLMLRRGHSRYVVVAIFMATMAGACCRTIVVRPESNDTLRDAIHGVDATAQSGDIVFISAGIYSGEANCGLEVMQANISIVGQDPNTTVIDCDGTNLRNLALRARDIHVQGLHLTNGTCDGSGDCPSGDGGALDISQPGTTVVDCIISNSYAAAHGGAISVSQSANSVFFDNVVATKCSSVRGGGIWSHSAHLTFANCEVSGNSAVAHGGGIYVYGNGITVSDSVFIGNSGFYWGGAIFNIGGPLIVSGARFEANFAAYWGAGIAVHSGTQVSLSGNTYFVSNSVDMEGGAVVAAWGSQVEVMDDVVFEGNSAAYDGGAIYAGPLWLHDNANCRVTIKGRAKFKANKSGQSGGAVSAVKECHVDIGENASFHENTAADRGGALFGYRDILFTLSGDVELSENVAASGGGAIAVYGAHLGWQYVNVEWANVRIGGNVNITRNSALVGGGVWTYFKVTTELGGNAMVSGNTAQTSGGGLRATNLANLLVGGQARVDANIAIQGAGAAIEDGGTLNVTGTARFARNRASWRGGAVAVLAGGNLTLSGDAALLENEAEGEGGAVFALYGGMMQRSSSVRVEDNVAWMGEEINEQADGVCGDGRLSSREFIPHVRPGLDTWDGLVTYCDDGNTADGDGCSSDCTVEEAWVCSGGGPDSADDCVPTACGDGRRIVPPPADPEAWYPGTCAGYRKHYGAHEDGDYTLYLDRTPSMPIKIYCHDMAGTPKEFLTLERPENNFVTWGTDSSAIFRTHFFKIRVKLAYGRLFVNQEDYTFAGDLAREATSPWFLAASANSVPHYGNARSCDGRTRAAQLDVRGLPVRLPYQQKTSGGYRPPWEQRSYHADMHGKTYYVWGGGWCSGEVFTHCLVELDGETFCMILDHEAHTPTGHCDDGNEVDGDGCSSTCSVEDGFLCDRETSAASDADRCTCGCSEGSCGTPAEDFAGSRCFVLNPTSTQSLPNLLGSVAPGDHVHLTQGRYLRQHCGGRVSVANVSISGAGQGRTVIDCTQDSEIAAPLRFLEVHAHGLSLSDLSVQHSSSSASHGGALSIRPGALGLVDASTTNVDGSITHLTPFSLPGWRHALRTRTPMGGPPGVVDMAVTYSMWLKVDRVEGIADVFQSLWTVCSLYIHDALGQPYDIHIQVQGNKLEYCEFGTCYVGDQQIPFSEWFLATIVHRSWAQPRENMTAVDRLEMYINNVKSTSPAADALGFPPEFREAQVEFSGPTFGQRVEVAMEGLLIWRRALLPEELAWLYSATSPAARMSGVPPSFNRDHLRPAYDLMLDSHLVFSAATQWSPLELQEEERFELKGRDEVQLRVGGSGELGGEVSFSLWAKPDRLLPKSTLFELSEIETMVYPFSNAIMLTVQEDGRVRYRLWQDPFQYPVRLVPVKEAQSGRVRAQCYGYETNASTGWFVDSADVLPVGAWTLITVVHGEVTTMYYDGVPQASKRIPLPHPMIREFFSVGRGSESRRPNKHMQHTSMGDLYGPDDLEVTPELVVHALAVSFEWPVPVYPSKKPGYGFVAERPMCGEEALTFQGSIEGLRVWNASLTAEQVMALAGGGEGSPMPPRVPLLGRGRQQTRLRQVSISDSHCALCDGGAVYAGSGARLRLEDCIFQGNSALERRGGAIASLRDDAESSLLLMSGTTVTGCEAREGGGLYWEGGNTSWARLTSAWPREPSRSVQVRSSNFSGNAALYGGAARIPEHRSRNLYAAWYLNPSIGIGKPPSSGSIFFPSSDGKWLYIVAKDAGASSGWDYRGLLKVNTETGEGAQSEYVLEHFVGGGKAKPSPDGKYSYWVTASNQANIFYPGSVRFFYGEGDAGEGVYRLDMETGDLKRLANTTRELTRTLAPSPDGEYLYYQAGPAIYRVALTAPSARDLEVFCGSSLVGFADGACEQARFNKIADLVVDGRGQWLYVADYGSNVVRRIDIAARSVKTLVGSGRAGSADGFGLYAEFSGPLALAWSRNMLYVLDTFGENIRMVDLRSHYVETLDTVGSAYRYPEWVEKNEEMTPREKAERTIPAERTGPLGYATGLNDAHSSSIVRQFLSDFWKADSVSLHVAGNGVLFYTDDLSFVNEVRSMYPQEDAHWIEDCVFEGNQAAFGGGLSLVSNLLGSEVRSTSFTNNRATDAGGAIHIAGCTGELVLEGCEVRGNTAETRGGGLFAEVSYAVHSVNCSWAENEAQRGGAMAMASHLDSLDLGLVGITQAAELAMALQVQIMKQSDVGATLALERSVLEGNRADYGAGAALLGNWSKAQLADSEFDSNVASECGSGVMASSRSPMVVEGELSFRSNVALKDGAAICLQATSGLDSDTCNPETKSIPMMLLPASEDAALSLTGNQADMGGAFFQRCRDAGEGATANLTRALHALEASEATLKWQPGGAKHGLSFSFSSNMAGYGVMAASQALGWRVEGARGEVLRMRPGARAGVVVRLLDVLGNTVQSASRALDEPVQLRMCDGAACTAENEYHIVVSLFPAVDGSLRWDGIDGAEVLAPLAEDGTVSELVTLELRMVQGALDHLFPVSSVQVRFDEPGPGQQYVTRRQWKGKRMVSVDSCSADQYIVDPKTATCVDCPTGATCDGSEVYGKVPGSVWTKSEQLNLVVLESCPPRHALINSTVGTSQGVFSHDNQQCNPCDPEREYVADPNRFQCRPCPVGGVCDGETVRSRDGLDELGARWEADADGAFVLVACPVGYKLVGAQDVGLDNQQCVKCPDGTFIMSSTDPSFECFPCPLSAICPKGGPPVFATSRSGTLAVVLGNADQDAVILQLVAAIALHFGVDPALVALEGSCSAGCGESPASASLRQKAAATSEHAAVQLRTDHVEIAYTLHFPREHPETLSAQGVAEALQGVMQQEGLSGSATAEIDAGVFGVSDEERAQWQYLVSDAGEVQLVGCPAGSILVNTSTSQPSCIPCPPTYYSLNPLDHCDNGACPPRSCNSCPRGAVCQGKDQFQSLVAGAEWLTEEFTLEGLPPATVMRIHSCPPGFVLIRREDDPVGDQCVPCQADSYSLEQPRLALGVAAGQAVATGQDPSAIADWCLPCPPGSKCSGGTSVVPMRGFWRQTEDMVCAPAACSEDDTCNPRQCSADNGTQPSLGGSKDTSDGCMDAEGTEGCRLRAIVVDCAPGVCLDEGECVDGHEGPVCGLCAEGYAKVSFQCRECSEADRSRAKVAFTVLASLVALLMWLSFSWGPLLPFLLKPSQPEADDIEEAAHRQQQGWRQALMARLRKAVANRAPFAVLVAAFQVLAAFGSLYQVRWEESLGEFLHYSNAANLDIFTVPGFACLFEDVSFRTRMLVATLSPICAVAAHALPLVCVLVMSACVSSESVRLRLRPQMQQRFWASLVFFGIIFYPVIAVAALKPFQCHWSLGLALQDLREHCPSLEPGFVYYWSVVFAVLYPFCIPVTMLAALVHFRVPQISRRKVHDAYIRALRDYLIKLAAGAPTNPADVAVELPAPVEQARIETGLNMVVASGFGMRRAGSGGESSPPGSSMSHDKLAAALCSSHDTAPLHLSRQELFWLCTQLQRVQQADPDESAARSLSGKQRRDSLDLDNMSNAHLCRWLYKQAVKLQARHVINVVEPSWNAENAEDKRVMDAIGGLFMPYKVKYWYWEGVEMLRKFVLASAVPILFSSTDLQIAAGLFVILLVLIAVLGCSPYRAGFLNLMQAALHFVLFCVLYSGRN